MNYRLGVMLGRLTNGAQADHGKLVHAVIQKKVRSRPCPYNDWGRDAVKMAQGTLADVSLCGKRPGRRSVGWDFNGFQTGHKKVTCEKCEEKLKKSRPT